MTGDLKPSDSCSCPQWPAATARAFDGHPLCARQRADQVPVLAELQAQRFVVCPSVSAHHVGLGKATCVSSALIRVLAFQAHSAVSFSLHTWPPNIPTRQHLNV